MRNRAVLLALALGAMACDNTNEPGGATTTLSLNTCDTQGLGWYAYRNTGGSWTRLQPNANGVITFEATEKVSLAFSATFFGATSTEIINATTDEIEAASAASQDCDFGFGDATITGSVTGISGSQYVRISAAGSAGADVDAGNTSFELEGVPSTGVDIVATRQATPFTEPADRVIVRRNVTATAAPIAALNFGTESSTLENATATFTGVTPTSSFISTYLYTSNGTSHRLMELNTTGNGTSFNYVSLPASLRVASDIHELDAHFFVGATDSRRVLHYYKTPSAKTFAVGPALSTPTVTTVSSTPLRLRAVLPYQSEYPDAVMVDFTQPVGIGGGRSFSIFTTAGFAGSTQGNWELEIPDLSSASLPSAAVFTNTGYDWDIYGYKGSVALLLDGNPTDGSTVFAATRLNSSASAAARRHPKSMIRLGR